VDTCIILEGIIITINCTVPSMHGYSLHYIYPEVPVTCNEGPKRKVPRAGVISFYGTRGGGASPRTAAQPASHTFHSPEPQSISSLFTEKLDYVDMSGAIT
jgi:hypothetical protein